MDFNIQPGLNAAVSKVVEYKDTAKALSSGLAEVFATPAMIALMENAALSAVQNVLPKGYSTVGIEISARHMAATPVGMTVKATAVLTTVKGRELTFFIEAFDDKDKIGEAAHKRFIIDEERFMHKADAKKAVL